jgi:hypothetical protein
VASGPDNAGTCQYCQMVRVRLANRKGIREEPASLRLLSCHRLEPGGSGPVAVRARSLMTGLGTPGRGFSPSPGGHGEGLRRSRGDAAGTKSGASFDERSSSEHGNRPVTVPGGGQPGRRRDRDTVS